MPDRTPDHNYYVSQATNAPESDSGAKLIQFNSVNFPPRKTASVNTQTNAITQSDSVTDSNHNDHIESNITNNLSENDTNPKFNSIPQNDPLDHVRDDALCDIVHDLGKMSTLELLEFRIKMADFKKQVKNKVDKDIGGDCSGTKPSESLPNMSNAHSNKDSFNDSVIAKLQREEAQLSKILQQREAQLLKKRQEQEKEALAKYELLQHFKHTAYLKLDVSKFHGVGVFAMRRIPSGVDPFAHPNPNYCKKEEVCLEISSKELDSNQIPSTVKNHILSFFAALTEDDGNTPLRDNDGSIIYGINATGLNTLDLSWYMNHSDFPNICYEEALEESTFCTYITKREIKEGEELTIDYRELGQEYYDLVQDNLITKAI